MIRRRRAGGKLDSNITLSFNLPLLSSNSDSLLEPDFEGVKETKEGNNPRKWHSHSLVSHRLRDPALLLLAALSGALRMGAACAAAAAAVAAALAVLRMDLVDLGRWRCFGTGETFSVGCRVLRAFPLAWALPRRLRPL